MLGGVLLSQSENDGDVISFKGYLANSFSFIIFKVRSTKYNLILWTESTFKT